VKRKILYGLYFFFWTILLVLGLAYFTDKYYSTATIFGPIVSLVVLTLTSVTFLILISFYIFKPTRRIELKKVLIICSLPIVLMIPFVVLYNIPNKLADNEQTIEVSYIAWACDCANWAMLDDIEKYSDNPNDTLADLSIFIEPTNESLELPDTIGINGDIIKLTGRFYSKKDFPKGYHSIEHPEKARVFRYTKYRVLRSNYKYLEIDSTE
jgi:hypothetical protein